MSTSLSVVYRDMGDRTWNYSSWSPACTLVSSVLRQFSVVHHRNSSCVQWAALNTRSGTVFGFDSLPEQTNVQDCRVGFFNTGKIYFPSWHKQNQTLVFNFVLRWNNTFHTHRLVSTQNILPAVSLSFTDSSSTHHVLSQLHTVG